MNTRDEYTPGGALGFIIREVENVEEGARCSEEAAALVILTRAVVSLTAEVKALGDKLTGPQGKAKTEE